MKKHSQKILNVKTKCEHDLQSQIYSIYHIKIGLKEGFKAGKVNVVIGSY